MRSGMISLLTALLMFSACSDDPAKSSDDDGVDVEDSSDESDEAANGDSADDEDEDEGDQTGTRDGGRDSGQSVRDSGATDSGGSRDTGVGRDSGGGRPDSSINPRDTGSGGGDDEDGSSDEAPSTGGGEPVIPSASMECPSFQSGTMNIMGLNVEITAGPMSNKKGPLLFYWHGTGSSPLEAGLMLPRQVIDEITREGGMIVAPDNTTGTGADSTVILGVWFDGDFEFADLVAACAVENYNIDPRRIYSTGCSAGGLHSGVMAFARSNYLAASVPNSGGIVLPVASQNRSRVPAVMTMHGAMGTDWVIVDFAEQSAFLNSELTKAGGFVINCDHGGGHCGAPDELKLASWQFMKDHPFGVDPEPYANGVPASFPSYCKIVE